MSTQDFYKNIISFRDPHGVTDPKNLHLLPSDWSLFLTDMRGSTAAIEKGRYKDVNMVGAASIAAVVNATRGCEIPYVFGGDGATFLIPKEYKVLVSQALLGVKKMARNEFKMDLRVGTVPCSLIQEKGRIISVGKYGLSEKVFIAILGGGGSAYAEELIKRQPELFELSEKKLEENTTEADFLGLECRWQPLKSQKGQILAILLKATPKNSTEATLIYSQIIEKIESLCGPQSTLRPASLKNLMTTLNPKLLLTEQKVRSANKNFLLRLRYLFLIWLGALWGFIAMSIPRKLLGINWMNYKNEVLQNSDYWKFDDMLRIVIDVSEEQKQKLEAFFEASFLKGQLTYGLHASKEALMTCFVTQREGNHVHFIDGGGGGYALAAKALKERLGKNNPKNINIKTGRLLR